MWVKDAADLYESRWQSSRLTYPKPMKQSAEVTDRRIVGLDTAGATVWWAQRGRRPSISTSGTPKTRSRRKRGLRRRARRSTACNGSAARDCSCSKPTRRRRRLRGPGKRENGHERLAASGKIDAFRVPAVRRHCWPAASRLTAGVLQWLDDGLQPTDQVMLPDGQKIAAYLPLTGGTAAALEDGGKFVTS